MSDRLPLFTETKRPSLDSILSGKSVRILSNRFSVRNCLYGGIRTFIFPNDDFYTKIMNFCIVTDSATFCKLQSKTLRRSFQRRAFFLFMIMIHVNATVAVRPFRLNVRLPEIVLLFAKVIPEDKVKPVVSPVRRNSPPSNEKTMSGFIVS